MSDIQIDLPSDNRSFRAGDLIEGVVSWRCDKTPKAVDVRLLHFTSGKGTRDVIAAEVMQITDPLDVDSRVFSFPCPAGPVSFDGRLVSLTWAIDALADIPGFFNDLCARTEIFVGPRGEPIQLYGSHE